MHNDRRGNTCAPWSSPCFVSRPYAFLTPTARIAGRKSHPTITHIPATMQVELDNWHNTKRFTTPCVKEQTFTNIKDPASRFRFWVHKGHPKPKAGRDQRRSSHINQQLRFSFYEGEVFQGLWIFAIEHFLPGLLLPAIFVHFEEHLQFMSKSHDCPALKPSARKSDMAR